MYSQATVSAEVGLGPPVRAVPSVISALIEKMRLRSRGVPAVLGKSGRANVRSLVDAGLRFSGTAGTERWSAQVAPVSGLAQETEDHKWGTFSKLCFV